MVGVVLLSPSDPSVMRWDRLFDSSSVKGDLCKTQWNGDNLLRFSTCQVGFS